MDSNVFIVAHKFLPQPDDDLVLYLNTAKKGNVLHITHSFSDAADRISACLWYKNGVIYRKWKTKDYRKFPETLIYLKEFVFTTSCLIRTGLIWDEGICMDGLCTFFGLFLRYIGRTKKIIYWAMDFVPESRFGSGIKNCFYRIFTESFNYRNKITVRRNKNYSFYERIV